MKEADTIAPAMRKAIIELFLASVGSGQLTEAQEEECSMVVHRRQEAEQKGK